MKAQVLAAAFLFIATVQLLGQDRAQTRSLVISQHGIVATEHPLASQAAVAVLSSGGTAVDAAIAANAMMGVVSPMMCGIGGDLFAIVYEAKTGRLHGLNASGWSPAGLTLDLVRSQGITNLPNAGIHAVTIPGAVDGWDKLLQRFGRKSLRELLAPAIQIAEEGFPVTELVAGYWGIGEERLARGEAAVEIFLPAGRAPLTGEMFRNPDLAWSYRQLASGGRKAFYQGPVTGRMLAYMEKKGGTHSSKDFAEFSAQWVEPISTTYRGWTVYQIPPNGQGIAALTMLNLMEQFPLADYGHNSARALHVLIEAKKLAYADMISHVADPNFSRAPVEKILSKDYARERARRIDPERADCKVETGISPGPGSDTTYLSVVDSEGNMVSFIQSVFFLFGSGLVADGTGFILQNRAGGFSLDPKHPNVVGPRKRPLHTIIPGFMSNGEKRIAFGIMGGWNQAQAHAQFVSNVADHGMNIQLALEAARFTKATFEGCDIEIESRVPAEVLNELRARGHELTVRGEFSQSVGGGQSVMRDVGKHMNYGASDPRKDGAATPQLTRGRAP
jgi:gamma-glutamyltranspeptidase / glutathione hydrolase